MKINKIKTYINDTLPKGVYVINNNGNLTVLHKFTKNGKIYKIDSLNTTVEIITDLGHEFIKKQNKKNNLYFEVYRILKPELIFSIINQDKKIKRKNKKIN